ncbi:MAG TPA: PQQ-binding-like beta-propeller repeat protein, partial [Spirillospora sp.]
GQDGAGEDGAEKEAAGGDGAGKGGHGRLLAVEPETGTVRWSRSLGSRESPEVAMLDGGVTLVSDGTALRALDADGDQFAVWRGDGVCGDALCPAVLESGRLLVVHHPDGAGRGETRMEAVRVPSGEVEWRREVPAYAALTRAGGRVFALRPRLSGRLLPAGVDIVEPADGRTTTAPAPISVNLDLPGPRPWLAAAGGLLYAAVPQAVPRPDGASRLVALRGGLAGTGPAELGGVPERDWPDACSLLDRTDLAAVRADRHAAEPARASAGPLRLPRPVSCRYDPPGGDPDDPKDDDPKRGEPTKDEPGREGRASASAEPPGTVSATPGTGSAGPEPPAAGPENSGEPRTHGTRRESGRPRDEGGDGAKERALGEFTVSVRWVGRTEVEASQMLNALQAAQAKARRRRDIGADEAYEIGPGAGMIVLRVGRCVVAVEADRPPGAAARVARSVAHRLHHPA